MGPPLYARSPIVAKLPSQKTHVGHVQSFAIDRFRVSLSVQLSSWGAVFPVGNEPPIA